MQDAQRLAEKYGGNPQSWEDVSYWLLQKSTQEYSTDPVVKFGFCRGLEPVNYVSHILERYDRYKQFLARHRQIDLAPRPTRSARASKKASICVRTASGSDRIRKSRSVSEGSS